MDRPLIYKLAAAFCLAFLTLAATPAATPERGDVNSDTHVDIGDPIFLLNYIFLGGRAPACKATGNANGDEHLDISDAITILQFLFSVPTTLPPMTAEEIAACEEPPPVTVVRHGRLIDVLDPGHQIDGKIDQLSNGVIRIRQFYYDGQGTPKVVVLLTKSTGFDNTGFVISPDLRRDTPYLNEIIEYPIPAEATNDTFRFVSIWCDDFPLTYAFAQLFDGP